MKIFIFARFCNKKELLKTFMQLIISYFYYYDFIQKLLSMQQISCCATKSIEANSAKSMAAFSVIFILFWLYFQVCDPEKTIFLMFY